MFEITNIGLYKINPSNDTLFPVLEYTYRHGSKAYFVIFPNKKIEEINDSYLKNKEIISEIYNNRKLNEFKSLFGVRVENISTDTILSLAEAPIKKHFSSQNHYLINGCIARYRCDYFGHKTMSVIGKLDAKENKMLPLGKTEDTAQIEKKLRHASVKNMHEIRIDKKNNIQLRNSRQEDSQNILAAQRKLLAQEEKFFTNQERYYLAGGYILKTSANAPLEDRLKNAVLTNPVSDSDSSITTPQATYFNFLPLSYICEINNPTNQNNYTLSENSATNSYFKNTANNDIIKKCQDTPKGTYLYYPNGEITYIEQQPTSSAKKSSWSLFSLFSESSLSNNKDLLRQEWIGIYNPQTKTIDRDPNKKPRNFVRALAETHAGNFVRMKISATANENTGYLSPENGFENEKYSKMNENKKYPTGWLGRLMHAFMR